VQVPKIGWLAAAALLALAACGSSQSSGGTTSTHSPTAYAQVLQRIASDETAAQQRVADAFQHKSTMRLRQALRTFALEQTSSAQRVAALVPPSNATAANAALVEAFGDSATAVQDLLGRISPTRSVKHAFYVVQSDRATKRAAAELSAALTQLKGLGYL
jgi:hypothetical protein